MTERFAIAILAAGIGTRLKSKRAKVLHSVGGRTLIEHAVRTARELAQGQPDPAIFAIVGHQAATVQQVLEDSSSDPHGAGVRIIHQKEQLGTGHALQCGRRELETGAPRLLVFCGDTPLILAETLRSLMEFHLRSQAAATVMTAGMDDPSGYGRIVRGSDDSLFEIVEHKSASPEQRRIREINTGIYCFETETLFAALDNVGRDGITGEYYLTDVIGLLRQQGRKVMAHKIADASEVIGINNRAELAQVDALLRDRKARELMLAGVTIFRPETVQIDPDVQIGADTVIEPGVTLAGETRIGEDCRIGAFSVIADSVVADDVTVKQSCIIEGSIIAQKAIIGPFARLRPGTEIGPGARIGNFVEVKKTRVGAGSKAQHLTYLGDTTIGENVNVGAGTITCNYDGEKKHPTVIEDNVFIGSDTSLVAPVRVGRNSYVGAGSTITEDVPADSLAIARGRQVNKEGWVRKRKSKPRPVK